MIKTAIEGYLLMLFLLLHLSLLTCDQTCLLPIHLLKPYVPKIVSQFSISMMKTFGLSLLTAQFVGQMMIIGDLFICAIFVIKLFGCLLKRFVLMFLSIVVSIYVLQKLEVLW